MPSSVWAIHCLVMLRCTMRCMRCAFRTMRTTPPLDMRLPMVPDDQSRQGIWYRLLGCFRWETTKVSHSLIV